MKLPPFKMESWLTDFRFDVRYNLAESGMRDLRLSEFLQIAGEDSSCLGDLLMEDMPTNGSRYLRDSIASCYSKVKPENLLVCTGTGEALFVLFNVLLEAGDEVVVSFPAFQALYEIPRAVGAKTVFYRHRLEESYRFDAERFCDLIREKTKLVVVNTPHNPTGAECDAECMRAIIEKAASVGAYVLFDEHYRFLPHDDREIIESGYDIADKAEHVFATGSITKCFGAMGLRVGWLVGDEKVLAKCSGFRDYLSHTLSPISERLTFLALKKRKKFLSINRAILEKNKKSLADWMRTRRDFFDYVPPVSGVVCFPGYKTDIDSRKLASLLIERGEVFCLPGDSFEINSRIRIGLGISPDDFSQALKRMGKVLDGLF